MSESMKKPQMKDETRKKVDNFWYYYKFHVLIGAFLLFMVIVFIKDMLGKVDYDYNIAFVTDYMIADEDSQALQGYFEANAEDLNGDGEVHVQIQNYVLPPEKLEDFAKVEDCAAYEEIGRPASVKDLYVAMRSLEGTKMEKDEEMTTYYDACETLLDQFVSGQK